MLDETPLSPLEEAQAELQNAINQRTAFISNTKLNYLRTVARFDTQIETITAKIAELSK